MATVNESLPLIVIVGPTASGKTSLAIKLAEEYGGEIICADSRTVYRDMNIGTAKPTAEEQAKVPHWGVDIVSPKEPYNAALFQQYAMQKIDEIRSRDRIPFLVGGTGLYVDAIIYEYQFPEPASEELIAKFEPMAIPELIEYCVNNNIELPRNPKNKRHLLHAILYKDHLNQRKNTIINNTIVVGITTNKDTLHQRIVDRTEQMFADGVVEEAKMLGKKYGWESEAMTGNIYPILRQYIDQKIDLEMAKEQIILADIHLAKRQMTWFRRNPQIVWSTTSECRQRIQNYLASEQ